jgi:hypothetical protein
VERSILMSILVPSYSTDDVCPLLVYRYAERRVSERRVPKKPWSS